MKAPEKYYTTDDVCVLLRLRADRVLTLLRAGELGQAVDLGAEGYRVPASGIKAYLKNHPKGKPALGTVARTVGELRRKAGKTL